MSTFSLDEFQHFLSGVTDAIAGMPWDKDLQILLNEKFPACGEVFKAIESACHSGIEAGLVCKHQRGGVRFGRVIEPTPALQGCAVDVVEMNDLVGPYHRHPQGEIDLIMPIDSEARFDDHPAGWLVYGPDSAHAPTVTGGRALILYLLPNGEIDFQRDV